MNNPVMTDTELLRLQAKSVSSTKDLFDEITRRWSEDNPELDKRLENLLLYGTSHPEILNDD
jgi:hypothetical protein